uniref:Uncharacterized protein n=1 Tax=Desulfovibrio sp. U5L TaxID=596152 RepID=I2Q7Q0_9BACT
MGGLDVLRIEIPKGSKAFSCAVRSGRKRAVAKPDVRPIHRRGENAFPALLPEQLDRKGHCPISGRHSKGLADSL